MVFSSSLRICGINDTVWLFVLFCTIMVNDVLKVLASVEEYRREKKRRTVPVR